LKKNDSFIAITIGARGSGKTAVSLSLMDALRGSKKNYFAMGFSRDALPNWIFLVDDVSLIKNDSLVLVDEGGILFSSRDSMSDANKFCLIC
jgi:Cdc6-like AAA superfamily ATPase